MTPKPCLDSSICFGQFTAEEKHLLGIADEAAGAVGRVGDDRCRLSQLVAYVDHK